MDLSDATWRKSTRSSANNDCVELAVPVEGLAVRDSKNPHGSALVLTPGSAAAFLNAVKRGRFDG